MVKKYPLDSHQASYDTLLRENEVLKHMNGKLQGEKLTLERTVVRLKKELAAHEDKSKGPQDAGQA